MQALCSKVQWLFILFSSVAQVPHSFDTHESVSFSACLF